MAASTFSQRSASAEKVIRVPYPGTGYLVVNSYPGATLKFDFYPEQAGSERSGNDLVLKLENGGTVVIKDFFATGRQPLPTLESPDGLQVAGKDFFAARGHGPCHCRRRFTL